MNSFLSSVCGGIIVAIVYCLGNIFANRKSKKLELKNYVSKVRFDAEFAIYRDLSAAFLEMVQFQNNLFILIDHAPRDPDKRKDYYADKQKKCVEAYNRASIQLYRNAPFIEESIFERFKGILNDVDIQLSNYSTLYSDDHVFESRRESNDEFKTCCLRTADINTQMDNLILDMRKYLKELDVL
jgi:hypothetical protein